MLCLRRRAACEGLKPPYTATTLRWKNGEVAVNDGPYAETKEQVGGILVLEARDLNHAIQLISQQPAMKYGPWEIRPAADLNDMIWESERRRKSPQADEHSRKRESQCYPQHYVDEYIGDLASIEIVADDKRV